MALDPRIRDAAGQFSAKGTLTARALRKAWTVAPRKPISRGIASVLPEANLMFQHRQGTLLEFDAVPSTFTADKIDEVNAIIRGVSVITSGLVARGHDLEVDDVTLAQMQQCAAVRGQVPVKVDHKSGAAAVCGFLSNFRQEENKLKADWYLLESHPQKAQILEVARRMPRGVGLSASFVSPDKPERTKTGKAAARCQELISVDYVTLPAANPDGMFAAQVDRHTSPMNQDDINAAIEAAVAKAIAPLSEQLAATQKQLALVQNPPTLEDVVGMDEAQLAELGLTPADVQEALEAAAQAEEAGETDENGQPIEGAVEGEEKPEGQGELVGAGVNAGQQAGAGAGSAGAATGFAALSKQLVELSAEVKRLRGQKQVDEEEVLLSSIEEKVQMLTEDNGRLMQALQAGGQAASPGIDRNNIRFFSQGKNEGEFENLVQLGIEEKKLTKAQSFSAVIKENPEAYQDYLVRLGVRKPAE